MRALGEVGLDSTVPVSVWRKQEVVLERVLGYALPDQCLVLHLRGTKKTIMARMYMHVVQGY